MKHVKCYIPDYPRPQFVRKDWVNLNGEWDFDFGDEVGEDDAKKGNLSKKINVPFSYETKLSGIGDTRPHNTVWYSRSIIGKSGMRTIINFEGADYETYVYVNGILAGTHIGAYSRFSLDVTDFLKDNKGLLCVKCVDKNESLQIRGKQRWEEQSYGCWYVQTTGLWKSVWIEYVADVRLTKLKITPSVKDSSVLFDFSVNKPAFDVDVRIEVSFDGKPVQTVSMTAADTDNSVRIKLDSRNITYQVVLWEMWNPALYDVLVTVSKNGSKTDEVGSYFGLREFTVKNGQVLMNGGPFYSKLVLDQGYWKDSGMTSPSEQALADDILLAKQMGFNGCRKHQKIEDERFYYYADILGFVVWCELPSNHWFCDEAIKSISKEWLDIVTQNYSHPSIVTWVLFNESWGIHGISENKAAQALTQGLYYMTKSIDQMRPVISNDGWHHEKSDIITIHNYEQNAKQLLHFYDSKEKLTEGYSGNSQLLPFADGFSYKGEPVILSEFGGTHYANDGGWGYGSAVHTEEEFFERFSSLFDAVKKMEISGYCYTQLTDVEQETNGLLTSERKPKVPLEKISDILNR